MSSNLLCQSQQRIEVRVVLTSQLLLDRDVDRDILWLWLSDVPQAVMADLLGESPDFVRKRWQRIRHRLRIEGTLVNPE